VKESPENAKKVGNIAAEGAKEVGKAAGDTGKKTADVATGKDEDENKDKK